MKFLHIMRSVNPEGGGPIEALVQSDPIWRSQGHSREIVSLDAPDDPWVANCPIRTHAMGSRRVKRGQRHVPWLRYGFAPALTPWLLAHVADYDTIIVNGLWNYADWAARAVLPYQPKPYFVFTHGMLDPWFRTAYPLKHCAKQVMWWLVEGPLLHGARSVLFTSEGERGAANGAFWPYRFAHQISGYGTADAPPASSEIDAIFRARVPRLGDRPFLLFLGRLHRKKGCDLLIDGFAALAQSQKQIDLVIAGPDSDDSLVALLTRARTLGIAERIHWPGMLRGEAKWGALHGCAAFVLPSHGENFGIAVVEALACGKPVLLSDRVNIASTIAADCAGLVRPDTREGTAALLRDFFALSTEGRGTMGERARHCFLDHFIIERVAHDALRILCGGATIEGPQLSDTPAPSINANFSQIQA